jgi:hypothetical protein
MSRMDKEYLDQLAWEYVNEWRPINPSQKSQEILCTMVSSFGVIETDEAIERMKLAYNLVTPKNTSEFKWYVGHSYGLKRHGILFTGNLS